MTWDMDTVLKILGIINGGAFVVLMVGDFVVKVIDKIVAKTTSTRDDAWVKKLDFWWISIKEIYEDYRQFFDKVSSFSRPRK